MSLPTISDRPSTPQHSHQNSYNSNYEHYLSFSSTQQSPVPRYQEHMASSTLTSNTAYADSVPPSAQGETFGDKPKAHHYSNGSEIGYAEMTSTEPQFIPPHQSPTEDKEAYRRSLLNPDNKKKDDDKYTISRVRESNRKRKCGCKVPVFWAIITVLLLLILGLALGLGLGLGLTKKSSSTDQSEVEASQTMIGGAISPKYFSRQGAFNGSGVAIASANQGTESDIFLFYQRYTGEILQEYFADDGSWHAVATVASSARNATPISTVAYVYEGVATTHLFYIDSNNYVRQKITSNSSASQTNIWYDGPLNNLNLKSHDSELVGMQACYWGNYYGSSSNFNQTKYPTKSEPTTGINLLYARDNTTFDQYDWTNGASAWNFSGSFTGMNTRAGIACQSWLTNTTQYFAMVDTTNTMRILWRDTDVNKTSTSTHPINQWTNTPVSIPHVHPSTSLGYTDYLAYQDANAVIKGININWAAENTSVATISATSSTLDTWSVDSSSRGVPGTHFAITALDTKSGGRQLALFYQSFTNDDGGDGMTVGWRDSSSQGAWGYAYVPVNQTA